MANVQNLASGVLAADITSSATTLTVSCGTGTASALTAIWPTTPFYVTVMPAVPAAGVANSLDSEVMKVTAKSSSGGVVSLTVTRAQRGTTAKAFSQLAIVTNGIYVDDILDRLYPVGSIYMSATMTTATAVGNALGGTWEAWGAGRVPVGVDTTQTEFDTAEETGGEKTHTLTVAEMPSHRHYTSNYNGGGNTQGMATTNAQVHGDTNYWNFNNPGNSSATGGDGAHNNLQPYITCYMYKRVA